MIKIGQFNSLSAVRVSENGMYLSDEEGQEILLPNKYVPEDMLLEDEINVFIYNDSKDRLTATTKVPKIKCNEFAYLQVKEVNSYGAFLDWGLEKDLLVPFSEQRGRFKEGQSFIVYMYLDEKTNRLVASSKLNRFLEREEINLEIGEEVDLLIGESIDIGVNVIINNQYTGLIFKNELFQSIEIGKRVKGYIKNIREDLKIDVSLQKQGYQNVEPNTQKILDTLNNNQGFLNLNDKSDPNEISSRLQMSKKTFKKAIGALYKKRIIRIEKDGIYLS